MPKRSDNIYKRKDERREARYPLVDSANHPKKHDSIYGKSYQEVKIKRAKSLTQGRKKPPKKCVLFFKDLLMAWQAVNRIKLKESSTSRYQNIIDSHILPALGNKYIAQVNTPMINRFLTEKLTNGRLDQSGGLSPSYVRSMAFIIRSAIAFGAEENICLPLQTAIAKPSIPKRELAVLKPDMQKTLEKELLEDMSDVKLLIYITLYTGIRIGEACALRWEDIDFNSNILHVRQTVSRIWTTENGKKTSNLVLTSPKTESSLRCIPICSKLHTTLCSFPHLKKSGFILTSGTDNSFTSPRTYEYRYKRILKKCKLEAFNYHSLRHTFATRCIECGVDIKSLSEFLGHSSVSITLNTYVHSSMELKRQQIEKLAI